MSINRRSIVTGQAILLHDGLWTLEGSKPQRRCLRVPWFAAESAVERDRSATAASRASLARPRVATEHDRTPARLETVDDSAVWQARPVLNRGTRVTSRGVAETARPEASTYLVAAEDPVKIGRCYPCTGNGSTTIVRNPTSRLPVLTPPPVSHVQMAAAEFHFSPHPRRTVEKAKTTPEQYPLSLNSLTTGCNQKSNRHPQMNLDLDQVEQTLEELRRLGAVVEIQSGGRVAKYKHCMYEWLGVEKAELAVMAELLLRGEQTVGELRGRAVRMEPIPDINALRPVLKSLMDKELVVELTPEGRGQVVSHALYRQPEFEELRGPLP